MPPGTDAGQQNVGSDGGEAWRLGRRFRVPSQKRQDNKMAV